MFVFIRKHQKWGLFFIGLVIISFLVFFSPYSSLEGRGAFRGSGDFGAINGIPVTPEENYQATKEVRLEYLLRRGAWPSQDTSSRQMGYDEVREAMQRLVLIRKLAEYQVHTSEEAVAERIIDYLHDRRQGTFDAQMYDRFIKERLQPAAISRHDFEEFVSHEVGIQHLITVAGLNGELVTPREAEETYRREHEQVMAQGVFFTASNYLASVTIDPISLSQYYTNHMFQYRIPERIQVSYVKFESTNYLAEADQQLGQNTNLAQVIDMLYQQRGTNFFKDELNQVLPLEKAKEKIKQEIREDSALRIARKKAAEFSKKLFEQTVPADYLDKLAAAEGYPVKVTEPFSQDSVPPDIKVSSSFTEKAFKLTPDVPFAPPITGEDGVYLIAMKNRLPSSIQPLDSIRLKVIEDFRNNQARDLALKAGQSFASSLTNGLAQGKTFEAVCAEAQVTPSLLPPFSLKTRTLPELEDRVSVGELKNVAFNLAPGKASGFRPTRQGGFILYVQSRVPVNDAAMKAELKTYMDELRKQRQFSALNEWYSKQVELAKLTMPASYKSGN